jgi:hypothetical protein
VPKSSCAVVASSSPESTNAITPLPERAAPVADVAREVVVPRRDAGVDDRDADARAVVLAGGRTGRVTRAGPALVVREHRRDQAIEVDAGDGRIPRERLEGGVRDVCDEAVHAIEARADAYAKLPQLRRDVGAVLGADDHP